MGVARDAGEGTRQQREPVERHADEAAVGALVSDLAAGLHEVSMPADTVIQEVRAVAAQYHLPVQALLLQSALHLQVGDGRRKEVLLREVDFDAHWNLRRLEELQRLARRLQSEPVDILAARRQIAAVVARASPFRVPVVVLAYGLYGLAVGARVGGGWVEAIAAGLVGLVTGALHYGISRSRELDLMQSAAAAFCGALTACLLRLVLPPFDAARAMFGGVSLLVPAMVLTIGVAEMAHEALESGVFRAAYGALRFLMLAFGIAMAAKLFGLFAPLPAAVEPAGLPWPVALALVGLGAIPLTVCLQGRWRDVPWVAAGALVAYGIRELTKIAFPPEGSAFLATFGLATVALVQRRLGGRLPAVLIIPGFLQIAPGFLGTETVLASLRPGSPAGDNTFFHVLLLALQLVAGLLVAEALFGRRLTRR